MLVESPTYLGALSLRAPAGLRPVPVPTDEHGIRPDLLADAFAASGARLVYLPALFANPHGATLAPERRAAVLDAVPRGGRVPRSRTTFRDLPDARQAASAAAAPLAADDPDGHVVHLRSLTKSRRARPAHRGACVARGPVAARLRRRASSRTCSSPARSRRRRSSCSARPAGSGTCARVRAALRERRDALAAAVAAELGPRRIALRPRGGLHLWVGLDARETTSARPAPRARA